MLIQQRLDELSFMPSSAELVCVDPKMILGFWPSARALIKAAIEATDLSSFEDTERQVLSGEQLLWIAWSGKIEAAATTHLSNNVCTIVACSGHERERWLSFQEQIEAYAKAEGCERIRIYGRKGWERVLKDFHVAHVILEKAI